MGGAGRPLHFFARALAQRGERVLFVQVIPQTKPVSQNNLTVLDFNALGFDETALRRAWFGFDPRVDSKNAFARALDDFEARDAERVVVYGDPFIPFVEWFPIFRARGYKIVYDALDDFEAFPEIGLYFTNLAAEKFLVAQSDLVVAVSTTLVQKLTQWNPRAPIQLLRQGFDADLFRAPQPSISTPSTERSPQRSTPPQRSISAHGNETAFVPYRLGFWGHINAFNIDVALIEFIARARPQWTIQLLGPIDHDANLPRVAERLRALPNVQLLGPVAHDALPEYLQTFDVALAPFPDNAFNRARDPLKIFEYLSGYKPVVAAHTPQLAGMPYVYLADTPDAFLAALERALTAPIERAQIDAYLREGTWGKRLEQLLAWLARARPTSDICAPEVNVWYADAALESRARQYIARTEQLLDERTQYIAALERDAAAKQQHIERLQQTNLFWKLKSIFDQVYF